MSKVTLFGISINTPNHWVGHAALVILGLASAMLIVYSPVPIVALIVFAIVLGVDLPTSLCNFLGIGAA